MTDFSTLKKGDPVFDLIKGWGKISGIYPKNILPVVAVFSNDCCEEYLANGKHRDSDVTQSLYRDRPDWLPVDKKECPKCGGSGSECREYKYGWAWQTCRTCHPDEKTVGWINLRRFSDVPLHSGKVFKSKDEALNSCKNATGHIATVRVSWSE